jgi:hypothetical protein
VNASLILKIRSDERAEMTRLTGQPSELVLKLTVMTVKSFTVRRPGIKLP